MLCACPELLLVVPGRILGVSCWGLSRGNSLVLCSGAAVLGEKTEMPFFVIQSKNGLDKTQWRLVQWEESRKMSTLC